jgi:predicted glutamine amidotransferase
MCGLVGFFGDISKSHREAFRLLSIFDITRGEDGYGICKVNNRNEVLVSKVVGTPFNLEYRHWNEERKDLFDARGVVNDAASRLLMGHNRAATVGKISDDTAHPFEFSRFVGAHNGTLQDWSLKSFKYYGGYPVDSQVMLSEMDEEGIPLTFTKVSGAMAVTIWDKQDHVFHMFRNADRPLYVTKSKNGKTIAWASEAWMLEVALSKARARAEFDTVDSVPINTLFTYKFENYAKGVELVEQTSLTPFLFQSHNHRAWGGQNGYRSDGYYDTLWPEYRGPKSETGGAQATPPQKAQTVTRLRQPDLNSPGWTYNKETGRFVQDGNPHVSKIGTVGLIYSKTTGKWHSAVTEPLALPAPKEEIEKGFPKECVKFILDPKDWLLVKFNGKDNVWILPDGTGFDNTDENKKYLMTKDNGCSYLPLLPRHTLIDGPDVSESFISVVKTTLPDPEFNNQLREIFILSNSRYGFWVGSKMEQSVWRYYNGGPGSAQEDFALFVKPDYSLMLPPDEVEKLTRQFERDNVQPPTTLGSFKLKEGPFKGERLTVNDLRRRVLDVGGCAYCGMDPTSDTEVLSFQWDDKGEYCTCPSCVPYHHKTVAIN